MLFPSIKPHGSEAHPAYIVCMHDRAFNDLSEGNFSLLTNV